MLNKNSNCYNIENNFKYLYNTAISTFSEHITIFQTLSIGIWQLKCQQRQTNETKNDEDFSANFSELSSFSSSPFWEKTLWNQKLLLLTATARRSCYTLVRPFPTLSCFPFFHKLFWNEFSLCCWNNQLFCLPNVKKILRILCEWTLKILFRNKRILT